MKIIYILGLLKNGWIMQLYAFETCEQQFQKGIIYTNVYRTPRV